MNDYQNRIVPPEKSQRHCKIFLPKEARDEWQLFEKHDLEGKMMAAAAARKKFHKLARRDKRNDADENIAEGSWSETKGVRSQMSRGTGSFYADQNKLQDSSQRAILFSDFLKEKI